jgi:hypothetical protein
MSRREFDAATKRAIRERAQGRCECHLMPSDVRGWFPVECEREPAEIDHRIAECLRTEAELAEPLTAEDGAHICAPCHKIKTKLDQAMRKKRNAHTVRRDRPKKPGKQKQKIQSRGFNKAWRKRMDGTVERRNG